MTKKALICGISGQDGAYLAKLLLEKNYVVFGTSRDAQMTGFNNLITLGIHDQLHFESMSLIDFRSVLQVVLKIKPDEIYNLAGQSSVQLSFQQPVETIESIVLGTINILEAIRFSRIKTRFYNACSSECFGESQGDASDEESPFRPRSPYGVAKASAYWTVNNYREAYHLFACSGILYNHESILRPTRFVTQKIIDTASRIANGQNELLRLGRLDIIRDWGWAPDYVEAMWLMLQQETAEDYVIATGQSNSLKNFVSTTFQFFNLDWEKYTVSDEKLFRPTDIAIGRGNPNKAKNKLGWQAKHMMKDVIKMMIAEHLKKWNRKSENIS